MRKEGIIAIILDKEGRFLIGKRSMYKSSAPGYWVPISGIIEEGENEINAVVREVFEELGVVSQPIEKIGILDTDDGLYRLHWWKVEIIEGKPKVTSNEFSEIRWINLKEFKLLFPIHQQNILFLELYLK